MDDTTRIILTFLVPAVVVALIGSISGILTARNQRNNSLADNAETITKAALSMLETMRVDITELRLLNKSLIDKAEILTLRVEAVEIKLSEAALEITRLVKKLELWIHGAGILYAQVIKFGERPTWDVPAEKLDM